MVSSKRRTISKKTKSKSFKRTTKKLRKINRNKKIKPKFGGNFFNIFNSSKDPEIEKHNRDEWKKQVKKNRPFYDAKVNDEIEANNTSRSTISTNGRKINTLREQESLENLQKLEDRFKNYKLKKNT